MCDPTLPSEPDYRREAVMLWLLNDDSEEYSTLLWHMLTSASEAEFDKAWKTFCALASAQYGRPHQCDQCGCVCRFMRLLSREECAIWECPKCHAVAASFGLDAWKPLGTTTPRPAYLTYGAGRDKRYDAIQDWLRDPELEEGERNIVLGLWFLEAKTFDGAWRDFAEAARGMFPPPAVCTNCKHSPMSFWRIGGGRKSVSWRCDNCGTVEVVDGWTAVEPILLERGASKEAIERLKQAGLVTPHEAADLVILESKKQIAQGQLPPPAQCFKCGETEWEFESASPNLKAAKWKCAYCGRVEMVTAQQPHDPKQEAREAILKEVQREVWRRDGGKCQRCGSRENLEFDHIIPVIRGGSSTARNLQLLCSICNGIKSDSEPGNF